jgi:hypothetical protein
MKGFRHPSSTYESFEDSMDDMRHKQTAVERDADLLEVMKQQAFSLPTTEIFKIDKKPPPTTVTTTLHKPINMPTPK